jgi:hypothetical protein
VVVVVSKMALKKTTITTGEITTLPKIINSILVSFFVLLFETVPMTNMADIDSLLYQPKFPDEHNIGHFSSIGFYVYNSHRGSRDRTNGVEKSREDGKRILIIDDEPDVTLTSLLQFYFFYHLLLQLDSDLWIIFPYKWHA